MSSRPRSLVAGGALTGPVAYPGYVRQTEQGFFSLSRFLVKLEMETLAG